MPSNHERIDGDVIYLRDHMYSLSGIRRVAEESPNFTLSNGMEVAEAAAIADRLQGVAPPPPPPVQQRPQAEEGEVPPGPWRADYRREEVPGVDLHLAVMPQWLRHVSIGPRLPVSGSYTLPSQQLRGAVLRVFKRAAEGGNEVAAPIVQRLENGAMVMWIPKKVDELGRWLPGTGFNNRA